LSRSTKLTDLAMCPNRGDRDLEQFGGHETDTFLRHDYATTDIPVTDFLLPNRWGYRGS
jgi:hypothetical protein